MFLRWLAVAVLLFAGLVLVPPHLDLQKIKSYFSARLDIPPTPSGPRKTVSVRVDLTEEKPRDPAKNAAPKIPVPVDSVPVRSQTGLKGWIQRKENAGYLDMALLESGQAIRPGPAVPVKGLLEVSGWAGEPFLGMRMRQVVLVYCGRMVAAAPVEDARGDVADKVHPNLARAGWRVWIASSHLSRECWQGNLMAWAIGPVGTDLWPLAGQLNLSLADESESGSENLVSPAGLPTPDNQPSAQPVRMSIAAAALRLRRCGSASCGVVGSIVKGTYDTLVLEDSDSGWLLVQLAGQAGWLDRRYVAIGK